MFLLYGSVSWVLGVLQKAFDNSSELISNVQASDMKRTIFQGIHNLNL